MKEKLSIKKFREMYGMTQDEFASAVGLTRGAISHYEHYKREPDSHFFSVLHEKLGVSEKMIGEMILDFEESKKKNAC